MKGFLLASLLAFTCRAADPAEAGSATPAMNNQRLGELIERVVGEVEGRPGNWQFELEGYSASVITDEGADRMRIIVPVMETEEFEARDLYRMLQANFDSTLDARYSIARGVLRSAFIHPLSSLTEHQFIDGLAQSINLAATYGTTYSSDAPVFNVVPYVALLIVGRERPSNQLMALTLASSG